MKRQINLQNFVWLIVLALSLPFICSPWLTVTAQNLLTPQERRGKQIYREGTSPSGKDIVAYLGDPSLEVPWSSLACANCHGVDGRGNPEAGVDPLNLTWEALTNSHGLVRPDGRWRPAYTERGVESAIRRGLDSAGNKLWIVMPRYQISKEDLADLIVYLKRLGTDKDPRISPDKIVLAQ